MSLENFLNHPEHETPEEVLIRYENFSREACELGVELDPDEDFIQRREKVSQAHLEEVEKRLNVQLPPSYRSFISTTGLFSGPKEYGLLPPHMLRSLSQKLKEEGWPEDLGSDMAFRLSPEDVARFDQCIIFSVGLYEGIYHYFRLDCPDSQTGEALVGTYDSEDYADHADSFPSVEPPQIAGFDVHIQEVINVYIQNIIGS